tara:strand:- start:7517 stop:8338 length:822 start_codon:yes stop_codon:yes gene_type:complete
MKSHEYADLFPMMPEMDLMRLAEDIKEKGMSDPIITLEGAILDGRNRFKACEINNITPQFKEYNGDDPLGFVVSHNLHRRHMNESQRGMVGAKLANLQKGGAGGFKTDSAIALSPPVSQKQAAEMLNIGVDSIKRSKQVLKDGIPELESMQMSGEISASSAALVSQLPKEEQRKAVSGGVAGVKDAAKKLKNTKKESADSSSPQESLKVTQSPPQTSGSDGRSKIPKWIPDDGERLWLLAKTDLDKILPSDKYREKVMNNLIKYATNRLEKNI